MKTLFISLFFILLVSGQLKSDFGIRTTLNLTSYNGNDFKERGITSGLNIGAWYIYPLNEDFLIQTELNLSFRGGSATGPGRDDEGYNVQAEIEDKLTFLEIPVIFMVKSSDKVFFGVGPYLGFLLDAKRKSVLTYPGREFGGPATSEVKLESDKIKESEFGVIFSVMFRFGEFDLSTRYMIGFTNITSFDPGVFDLSNNNLQLGLGFSF